MDNIKQRVADRIKEFRKAANLTQKELGEKMGLTESTVNQYESGKLNPTILTIQKIAAALEVEVYSLFK